MSDLSDLVADVVGLNGGEMVTKIRLQKTFYFLVACGLIEDDLDFEYRYYGPFSVVLARAADDAEAQSKLTSSTQPGFHSEPYTVYRRAVEAQPSGSIDSARVGEKLAVMRNYSGLELEVAATIHFLRDNSYGEDAIAETKRRKPVKASEARVERAISLLRGLELA